jgi:hypothetical protein
MRTITTEVGSRPIKTKTYPVEETNGSHKAEDKGCIDSGERVPVPMFPNDNITSGMDGKRERCELNLAGGPAPAGVIVDTIDNGPVLKAANDNSVPAIETNSYPLREMYERGELGVNEIENRCHWFDAERFKTIHSAARGEPDNSEDNWRELLLEFFETLFGNSLTSFTVDKGLVVSDDGEFEDSATPADYKAVDNAGWEPTNDLAPYLRQRYAQQIVGLMGDVLGNDYRVLCAAIERRWTNQQIGETEGYTNRASASACGKGMLRSALRNLSRFYRCLDRIEERGTRPQDVWPLVGAYTWPPVAYARCRTRDLAFMNQAVGPVRKWDDAMKIAA